jgi:hypothetical protein
MYVVFYTERLPHGEPDQLWANDLVTGPVYLHDRWEVCDDKEEAVKVYRQLIDRDSTHNAGIAPISEEYSTDW